MICQRIAIILSLTCGIRVEMNLRFIGYPSCLCSAVGVLSGVEIKDTRTRQCFFSTQVLHQIFYIILMFGRDCVLGFPDFCNYFIFHRLLPLIEEVYIFLDMYILEQRIRCESAASSLHCLCVDSSKSEDSRHRGKPKLQHAERHPLLFQAKHLLLVGPWQDRLLRQAWTGLDVCQALQAAFRRIWVPLAGLINHQLGRKKLETLTLFSPPAASRILPRSGEQVAGRKRSEITHYRGFNIDCFHTYG